MMTELKPCPFCGGDAETIVIRERQGYGSYEQTITFHAVRCRNCDAQSKRYEQKPLCDYTNHTVSDFRENPILRAKVEDDYDAYIAQTVELSKTAWNTRASDVEVVKDEVSSG